MAFPTIASITTTASANSSGASNNLSLPATIDAGDLLIGIIGRRDRDTWTPPTGWTEIVDVQPATENATLAAAYKIADGTEDGGTITFTSSGTGNLRKGGFVLRITGWHGSQAPEAATASASTTTDPNPPSLTASWGAEDNLWIVASSSASQNSTGSAPTNYINFTSGGEAGGTKWGVNMATRENAVATEDPGTINWTTDPTGWGACTIVARPAGAGVVAHPGGKLIGGILTRPKLVLGRLIG